MTLVARHQMNLADAETLEAFYAAQTSTRTQFMQFSRGPAILTARTLDLGDVRVLEVEGDGTHIWQDEMLAGNWRFAIITDCDASVRLGNIDVTPSIGHLMRPGDDAFLRTDGRYRTLEITLEQSLVERLGWSCVSGQAATLDRRAVAGLVEICSMAMTSCGDMAEGASQPWIEENTARWKDLILHHLERVLDPWFRPMSSEAQAHLTSCGPSIFEGAKDLLLDIDYAKSASVDTLAESLGVARRTLFLAFKNEIGVGPHRFREIVLLNALRSRLFRERTERTTVTEMANDLGFSELGRLAANYKDLFGESPSHTLRHV